MSKRRMAVLWISSMLLVVAVASCRPGGDDGLDALRDDGLSSYVPNGTRLESSSESPGGGSKDVPARLTRRFVLDDGVDLVSVVDDLVEEARRLGWEIDGSSDAISVEAHKEASSGQMLLSLTGATEGVVLLDLTAAA